MVVFVFNFNISLFYNYYLAFILGVLLADSYFDVNLKSKTFLGFLLIVGLFFGSLNDSGKGLMRDFF